MNKTMFLSSALFCMMAQAEPMKDVTPAAMPESLKDCRMYAPIKTSDSTALTGLITVCPNSRTTTTYQGKTRVSTNQ